MTVILRSRARAAQAVTETHKDSIGLVITPIVSGVADAGVVRHRAAGDARAFRTACVPGLLVSASSAVHDLQVNSARPPSFGRGFIMRVRIAGAALAAVAVTVSLVTVRGSAAASPTRLGGSAAPYEIALIGDMPYGDVGRAQFHNVIAEINHSRIAFTAFDGDIKNGSERCDQWQYDLATKNFGAFRQPLIYVPGDNEWTDCDRVSNGGYDANERLALVRRTFFGTPFSLGERTLRLTRQSAQYPENLSWTYGRVTYAGLNIPGSDNNAPQFDSTGRQIDGDQAEYTARNAANLTWLDQTFAAAKADHSAAVVIVIQADMWSAGDPTAHFTDTKRELARLSIGFPGQVVLINGDSHFLQIDKPLTDANNTVIQNFTRVQTFGSAQNHWVTATVNPRDPNIFTFHQHIVAANLPTYVSP
jgi:hypothetical protein